MAIRRLWRIRRPQARGIAALIAGFALILGLAGPAYASGSLTGPTGGNAASGNYNIFEGGSNTTYLMMTALSNLFNESPGCDLAAASGSVQPLNYACPGISNAPGVGQSDDVTGGFAGPFIGEDGFTPFANENPFNDLLIEEPALGSSNGIAELEDQGTHAGGTSNVTFTASVTGGSTTVTAGSTNFEGVQVGDAINDSATGNIIPSGDTVASVASNFSTLTLTTAATGSSTDGTDSVVVTENKQQSPLDVARSSRAPNLTSGSSAGDDKGLNFVAYAMDGVSWLHWTSFGGNPTPSANVSNLTVADLTAIFSGQPCTVGGTTYTIPNWACYGGSNAYIDVYWAQNGSGTESTWATLLNPSGSFPYYPGLPASHVIFENETASITANDGQTTTLGTGSNAQTVNEGAANAIFLFSYGKYSTVCTPTAGYCGNKPSSDFTGQLALGQINGIGVNQGSITAQLPSAVAQSVTAVGVKSGKAVLKLAEADFPPNIPDGYVVSDSAGFIPADTTLTAIKFNATTSKYKLTLSAPATGTQATDTITFTPPPVFPGDRLLYNVYSDGSNSDIPQSSLAALNAVSEDGFLCKPSTASDVDPNTGSTYLSEIQSVISGQGFFPLPLEVEDGNGSATSPYSTTASDIPNPAWTGPSGGSGLSGSKYDAAVESGAPYDFPTGDLDTDNSAVSGTYTIHGTSVTASAGNPVGYCLVLTTDGNSTP